MVVVVVVVYWWNIMVSVALINRACDYARRL